MALCLTKRHFELNTGDFERFHYFTFETSFLENEKLFLKNRS